MKFALSSSILLLFLMLSCSENVGDSNNPPSSNEDNENPKIISSRVNELRVRDEPNTTSKVLYLLGKNEEVEYFGEQTDFKEKIKMGNREYTEPWLKIKTKDGTEGWAFGGGLSTGSSGEKGTDVKKKEFEKMSPKKLAKVLGLEIELDFPGYKGYYEYYETSNGAEILHGKFEISADKERPELGEEMGDTGVSYKGQFVNGTKDGEFTEDHWYWEGGGTITLFFDAKSSNCLWGSVDYASEGMELKHKVENPSDCTFAAIDKEAGEKGEWGGM